MGERSHRTFRGVTTTAASCATLTTAAASATTAPTPTTARAARTARTATAATAATAATSLAFVTSAAVSQRLLLSTIRRCLSVQVWHLGHLCSVRSVLAFVLTFGLV